MKILVILIGVLALNSCSAGVVVFSFYVVVSAADTVRFFGKVDSIAKEYGLETATGQIEASSKHVFTILEGRGRGVKLWVQNVILTGQEDPALCGVPKRNGPYADPSQFEISTEPRYFGSKADAKALGERMLFRIKQTGFDVRTRPVVCGAAALRN